MRRGRRVGSELLIEMWGCGCGALKERAGLNWKTRGSPVKKEGVAVDFSTAKIKLCEHTCELTGWDSSASG